ncbi:MAG: hypothetical protein K2Y39_28970 [Candidatus Obscuribacterales bacterium]|nr:hypothetical protein [Candidatus Obscuribacterales bacterium]
MSKTKLKESSIRFLNLLKLSIVSFVTMGILIGYHGAHLINSLIGAVWFLFAVTASLVIIASLSSEDTNETNATVALDSTDDDDVKPFIERRKRQTLSKEKVFESVS